MDACVYLVFSLCILFGLPDVLSPVNAQKMTLEDCVVIVGRIAKKEKDGGQMAAQDKKRFNQCNVAINPNEWTGKERLKILKVMPENPEIFGPHLHGSSGDDRTPIRSRLDRRGVRGSRTDISATLGLEEVAPLGYCAVRVDPDGLTLVDKGAVVIPLALHSAAPDAQRPAGVRTTGVRDASPPPHDRPTTAK